MSDEVLVKVDGVSKKFCRSLKRSLWYGVQDVSAEMFGRNGSHEELRKNEFWAVNDVSFELKRGECLGLIGPNGAGKSTLLKMLNGLVKPDQGRITMRGRVGALIELGAGFNPILTARENIYINGSVLGFSKREIDEKFDAIVDFAEIEEFIDTPVQNYSSGMKVRLGFAVAAQMEPDVLLIDEVLAVGDAGFVTKCMNKISILAESSTIILVSHSMPMVSRMASHVILLFKGRIDSAGEDVAAGIQKYFENFSRATPVQACDGFELTGFEMKTTNGIVLENGKIGYGEGLHLNMSFRASRRVPKFYVNVSFKGLDGRMIAQCFSLNSGFEVLNHSDNFNIALELDEVQLNPGKFEIQVDLVEGLDNHRRGQIVFKNTCVDSLHVIDGLTGWAPVQFKGRWEYQSP